MKEIYTKKVMVNDQNSRILIGNIERLCLIRTSKINVAGEMINTILSASVTKWTLERDIN
ncbi:hypothetical protein FQT07_02795 [Enterococcus hirae]|uniref:hypothetical protein n=1 Tax=Enterococcus hirae TaxID=1354 RepID=UPI0019E49EF1|nr:hypothetical protein [Enterococcus hirae]MBO1088000.1 hypothetical protein [Enterococcus hirae]MEB7517460.1 hypothetical protein [Enterococcus hirae]